MAASALYRSVKIDISQTHLIDIVIINLRAKSYQNFAKVLRVMGSFANCHILAWALPRSRKSGIWQFLCLDCVNINAYTHNYQNVPYG